MLAQIDRHKAPVNALEMDLRILLMPFYEGRAVVRGRKQGALLIDAVEQ